MLAHFEGVVENVVARTLSERQRRPNRCGNRRPRLLPHANDVAQLKGWTNQEKLAELLEELKTWFQMAETLTIAH